MIEIKLCNDTPDLFFDFISNINEEDVYNVFTIDLKNFKPEIEKDTDYYLIYEFNVLVGVFSLRYLKFVMDTTDFKCCNLSNFFINHKLQSYTFDEVCEEIDDVIEENKVNLSLLKLSNKTYKKYGFEFIGTSKIFTLNKESIDENINNENPPIFKKANIDDIELLNEFYVADNFYIERSKDDWECLFNCSKYDVFTGTNGEELGYAVFDKTSNTIIEFNGDINFIFQTLSHLCDMYNLFVIKIQYNGLTNSINVNLHKICDTCILSPIANVKIFNSTQTLSKLNMFIEKQGYVFENLSYEDEEDLCKRILGFDYLPSNKYQFVRTTYSNFSVAVLK